MADAAMRTPVSYGTTGSTSSISRPYSSTTPPPPPPDPADGAPRAPPAAGQDSERQPVRMAHRQLLLQPQAPENGRVQVVRHRVPTRDPEVARVVGSQVKARHLVLVLVGEELEPRIGHRPGQGVVAV